MASGGEGILVPIIIAIGLAGVYIHGKGSTSGAKARDDEHNKKLREQLSKERSEFDAFLISKQGEISRQFASIKAISEQNEKARLAAEHHLADVRNQFKTSYANGIKWLADFIGDADKAYDEMISAELLYKKRPAIKAADEVAAAKAEKRELKKQLMLLRCELQMYKDKVRLTETEQLELADDIEASTIQTLNKNVDDCVSNYLSGDEYKKLSSTERNQLALDRYLSGHLSRYEIGKLYERFVGMHFERKGFAVEYYGLKHGLEDRGIDLVCTTEKEVILMQLKCWSKDKFVHEKHVFQLYGSSLWYNEHYKHLLSGKTIRNMIITSTKMSDFAARVAKLLDVDCFTEFGLDKSAAFIKCNINKATKERIYHLPFDQKYDAAKIDPRFGEFYARTVVEAENKGFRRAMRHVYSSTHKLC